MNWRRILRIVEVTIVVLICSFLLFIYFHYIFNMGKLKYLGILIAYFIYKSVKFIMIRNKRLVIPINKL